MRCGLQVRHLVGALQIQGSQDARNLFRSREFPYSYSASSLVAYVLPRGALPLPPVCIYTSHAALDSLMASHAPFSQTSAFSICRFFKLASLNAIRVSQRRMFCGRMHRICRTTAISSLKNMFHHCSWSYVFHVHLQGG